MIPLVHPSGLRKLCLFLSAALAACGGGGGGGGSSSPSSPGTANTGVSFTAPEFTRGFAQFTGAPSATAAGDLDGDGRDDLVVVTTGAGSEQVYVFYQRANGPESVSIATSSPNSRSTAVCDVDGDGKNEILVGYSAGALAIYKPDTDGRPVLSQTLAGIASASVLCADLDGDGLSDVITTGKSGAAMQVLLQRDGALIEQGSFPGSAVSALDVGDINGDGKADIVAFGSSVPMVYLQSASGQFDAPVPLAGAPADVKGLAVATATRNVVFSTAGQMVVTAPSGSPVSFPTMANAGYVRVRDLNGDGRADIAVFHDGALGIYYQNADGTFAAEQVLATYPADPSIGASPIAIGDFDGDGKLDVAVASQTGVSLFFQDMSP
jgi:hypothetical protein